MTVSRFEELCKKLHIAYRSDDEGTSYFYTQDYKKSVRAIYVLAQEEQTVLPEPSVAKKSVNYIAIALTAIAALLVILILVLWKMGKEDEGEVLPPVQNEQQLEEKPEEKPEEQTPTIVIPKMKGIGILAGLIVSVEPTPAE